MKTEDKVIVAVIVTIFTLIAVAALSFNTEEWSKTEDPDCFLRTYEVNTLFAPDQTIRTRYCEVE
jgi:LPS O-antigen subunit length determinant protein (WzzB/FepE family)